MKKQENKKHRDTAGKLRAWALALFFLSASLPAGAQTPAETCKRVLSAFSGQPRLRVRVEVKMLTSGGAPEQIDAFTCLVERDGARYCLRYEGVIDHLNTGTHLVTVDHLRKRIQVRPAGRSGPAPAQDFSGLMVDTLALKAGCVITRVSGAAGEAVLRLDYPSGSKYGPSTVSYDTASFLPKHVTALLKGQRVPYGDGRVAVDPLVEVTYSGYELSPAFNAGEFDISRYVSVSGGRYVPNPRFSAYTVTGQP